MKLTRRQLLKGGLATAGAAAAGRARARERRQPPPEAVGMLYDATRCIGCRACVTRCRQENKLPYERSRDGLYDEPVDLSGSTKNVIRLATDGPRTSFLKAQCMHCVDPACAEACMLGAFKKREYGIVSYDPTYCIGCRYCEVACPYGVPKFEWSKAAPKMVKCELCKERLAVGKQPACTEVCPRKAVIFGKRDDLLKEAKRRLADNPGKYVQKIYGETDGGGTQCLYISSVSFEKLGFPALTEQSTPTLQRTIQHSIYKGFAAPIALYGVLGAVMLRNRRHEGGEK